MTTSTTSASARHPAVVQLRFSLQPFPPPAIARPPFSFLFLYASLLLQSSVSGHIPTPDFSFEDICKATGNFSPGNKIGEGGFGIVYKGKLKDGSLVAIKRAKKGLPLQFKNEILTLSKIEHLNLVSYLDSWSTDVSRLWWLNMLEIEIFENILMV